MRPGHANSDQTNTARAAKRAAIASSTVAVGTAAAFIFSSAVLGLMADRRETGAPTVGAGWTLRGPVGAPDELPPARRQA